MNEAFAGYHHSFNKKINVEKTEPGWAGKLIIKNAYESLGNILAASLVESIPICPHRLNCASFLPLVHSQTGSNIVCQWLQRKADATGNVNSDIIDRAGTATRTAVATATAEVNGGRTHSPALRQSPRPNHFRTHDPPDATTQPDNRAAPFVC